MKKLECTTGTATIRVQFDLFECINFVFMFVRAHNRFGAVRSSSIRVCQHMELPQFTEIGLDKMR